MTDEPRPFLRRYLRYRPDFDTDLPVVTEAPREQLEQDLLAAQDRLLEEAQETRRSITDLTAEINRLTRELRSAEGHTDAWERDHDAMRQDCERLSAQHELLEAEVERLQIEVGGTRDVARMLRRLLYAGGLHDTALSRGFPWLLDEDGAELPDDPDERARVLRIYWKLDEQEAALREIFPQLDDGDEGEGEGAEGDRT